MIQLLPLIIHAQQAGYEYLLLILLVVFWGIYRYYKSSKTSSIPDPTEEDSTNVPDYDIPEAKAVFRDPFPEHEVNIYNSRSSDPISVSIIDTSVDNAEDQQDTAVDHADFDPKKAVIWSELLKRPYC